MSARARLGSSLLPRFVLALGCSLALGVSLAAGGCGSGSACNSSADCLGSLECAGPDDPQACGIPGTQQCASDADCDPSQRCHAIPDPCSADEIGSECRQPCSAGGCGEGFRCLDSGACEATPCDAGFECAAHMACDPEAAVSGPVHARAHGCLTIACSDDAGCPVDGACVNGSCQSGPGSCVEPELVP